MQVLCQAQGVVEEVPVSASTPHSDLDNLRALEQWAFNHPDHICNGLCPDEDPPSKDSPGMASRDPECEWCQRIDLFHGLLEQYAALGREIESGVPGALTVIVPEARWKELKGIEVQFEAYERVVEQARIIRQLEETGTWPDFQPLADALDALNVSSPASIPKEEE